MDKINNHTAHYQLCSFIQSKKIFEFDLISSDIAILFIIARYLDMPLKKCFTKQSILAKECFMSERHLRIRCHHLVKEKLLFRYMKDKLYHYELGEMITGIDQF